MARPITAKLDDDQVDHLQQMVDVGEASSISEAVRMQVGRGSMTDTALRRTIRRFADSSALLGLFWVGLTFLYPLGFRAFAIPVFAIAVSLYAAERVLGAYEPAISMRLVGLFRGEAA